MASTRRVHGAPLRARGLAVSGERWQSMHVRQLLHACEIGIHGVKGLEKYRCGQGRCPTRFGLLRKEGPPIDQAYSPECLAPCSADEAETAQAQVEDEERVDGEPDPVLDDAAAAENADAGGHGPGHQDDVDGDAHDGGRVHGRQEGGDDEREERVADDADALSEGAAGQDRGLASKNSHRARQQPALTCCRPAA